MLEAFAHVIKVVRKIGRENLHLHPYSVTFNNVVLIIITGALNLQFYRMECGCFAWHFTYQGQEVLQATRWYSYILSKYCHTD